MKSYTNKQGEQITVSKEHLEVSVKIKQELQKASPQNKCAWSTHKKLMEKEGFFDSEVSENYRCLVKRYQEEVGELPEAPKFADMVADKKLESIKEYVGEIAFAKRENQHVLRQLNKVKRDVIDYTLFVQEISNVFSRYDWSDFVFNNEPIAKTKKKMIVCLSDLHIGALVDTDINKYDLKVAKRRLGEYINKVFSIIERDEISEVYLINLGDSIENPYMHNLSYTSEFVFTEQVAVASDLIIKFMIKLAEKANVTVAGIAGNHDRINEDKKKNLDGDHAVRGINIAIESFIENAKPERITYEQAKDYEHSTTINGRHIKFLHGDLDGINDRNLIATHSSLDGVDYSLILMGHYHHHWIKEQGIDKCVVGFGSLKGADGHGEKTRRVSSPSQGVVIFDEDGNYEVKRIKLS
jgi:hypothetical protein